MIDQKHSQQFDNIYNETYEETLKFVVCHCSNINDVNDIIQETYFELYKILCRKELSAVNIKAFVKGIANNKVKKHYTVLYKLQAISLFSEREDGGKLADFIPDNESVENTVLNKELSNEIWEYIKTKKLIVAKIFFLYYYSNITIKEIAENLSVGESYVKNCLYRTLKELKDTFGKERC